MRILAIFLVIFNHCSGYTLYQISGGYKQWIYLFITMFTRINVPLFLMISGALLLGKSENCHTLLKKRFKRFLFVIVAFETALYLEYALLGLKNNGVFQFDFRELVTGIFSGTLPGTGSYWYLYAYLGFILMLPFLRKIAKEINREDILMLIIFHFIMSSLLPMFNIFNSLTGTVITISGQLTFPLSTTKAFFYPLVGYYLEKNIRIDELNRKQMSVLALAALVGIVLSSCCTLYQGTTTGTFTQDYVQLFDYMTTIASYLFIKFFFVVKMPALCSGKISSAVSFIGTLTFGIYLLDPFLKVLLFSKAESFLEPFLPTILVSFSWCLISMLLGGILTYLLKRIPGIRKLL